MTRDPNQSSPALTHGALLRWFAALAVLTLIVFFACSLVGHTSLPEIDSWRFWEWPLWTSRLWTIRAFRLLAAATVGAGLAVSGMALQALLRNPLAEPFVLGISSGAGIGVLLGGILAEATLLPQWAATPLLAATGAVLTIAVVFSLTQRRGYLDPYVLLLSGVIVNVINGALIMAILQCVKQERMIHFIGWQMGHVPEYLWSQPWLLVFCAGLILFGWSVLFLRSSALNVMGLGDDVAASSGVAVAWIRRETFLLVSFMTAAAVALAGPIGFVGLIVPHVCRLVVGPDHRRLTILSGFCGAMFLMAADTLCRVAGQTFQLGELPVGVMTAAVGGPLFLFLLRQRMLGGNG